MQTKTVKFENQLDAAAKLLEILPKKELNERKCVVICTSLDSVIMVDEICKGLGLNYEMLFCEPITAPNNDECVIACVSETEEVVLNDALLGSFGITYDFIYGEAHRRYEEKILKNIYKFRKGDAIVKMQGRNVLMIDEGCETGITALACVKTLIKSGAKTITYATPIIATDVAASLVNIVDDIYTVEKIAHFIDVDSYYKNKLPSDNDTVLRVLEESPRYLPLQKQQKGEKENAI